MKKVMAVTLLFFILLASGAYAQVSTIYNPQGGSEYNRGDQIIITGQIILDQDLPGAKVVFSAVTAANETTAITTKYYSFLKDTPTTFSQIYKDTLRWNVPADAILSDNWRILAEVFDDSTRVQSIHSSRFTVTDELTVFFGVNQKEFNLGETLEISGTILNIRGEPVEGTADISIEEKEVGTVKTDTVTIESGYLSYSHQFQKTDPSGKYSVEVSILDTDGNTGDAKTDGLVVSGELAMTCELQDTSIAPEEATSLIGTLKDVHGNVVESAAVSALVTDPLEEKTLSYTATTDANGNFAFDFSVPSMASPGEYTIEVTTNDSAGNIGECIRTFKVGGEKAVKLKLSTDNTWYYTGDTMNITITTENIGNLDLVGSLKIYVDAETLIDTKGFDTKVSEKATATASWKVAGTPGNHTINVIAEAGGQNIEQSMPKSFSIVERPKPPKVFKLGWGKRVLLLFIVLIIAIAFFKKKDIKEFFWHREFKKKFQK
jgi:hypothetical protein